MFQKHEGKRMNEIDIKSQSKSGNEYSVLMTAQYPAASV